VRVRYRRDLMVESDLPWKEVSLGYVEGTDPPQFSKQVHIDEGEGVYEYEFSALDAGTEDGPLFHTERKWQPVGTFSVKDLSSENKKTVYESGSVDRNPLPRGGAITFTTTWSDPENNYVVDVRAKYRKEPWQAGDSEQWTEVKLDYVEGTQPPQFQGTTHIETPFVGAYEYQFDATDALSTTDKPIHTPRTLAEQWTGGGTFIVEDLSSENQKPVYESGSVDRDPLPYGGAITFTTTWSDPENDYIVDVRAKYRKEPWQAGDSEQWTEVKLAYVEGTHPPQFQGTTLIDGPFFGRCEYEFDATDVLSRTDKPIHTPRTLAEQWTKGGTFVVEDYSTSNAPPKLIVNSDTGEGAWFYPESIVQNAAMRIVADWTDLEKDIIYAWFNFREVAAGDAVPWEVVKLSREHQESNRFSNIIINGGKPGQYDYEFFGGDVIQLNDQPIHTVSAKKGTFTIQEPPSNNHPPTLKIVKVPPKTLRPGRQYEVVVQAHDDDNNLAYVDINFDKGETERKVTPGGDIDLYFRTIYRREGNFCWSATAYDGSGAKSTPVKGCVRIYLPRPSVRRYRWNGPCRVRAGNPIDIATGSQIIKNTLLSARGVIPVNFDIAYLANPDTLQTGNLGRGWQQDNYFEARLEQQDEGRVIVHWAANRDNEFVLGEDGHYRSTQLACLFDTLEKQEEGDFIITRKDGRVFHFNPDGHLQALSDPKGRQLVFNYDSAGRLNQVTEPVSGAFLHYAYNDRGFISSVTDPLGREVLTYAVAQSPYRMSRVTWLTDSSIHRMRA